MERKLKFSQKRLKVGFIIILITLRVKVFWNDISGKYIEKGLRKYQISVLLGCTPKGK